MKKTKFSGFLAVLLLSALLFVSAGCGQNAGKTQTIPSERSGGTESMETAVSTEKTDSTGTGTEENSETGSQDSSDTASEENSGNGTEDTDTASEESSVTGPEASSDPSEGTATEEDPGFVIETEGEPEVFTGPMFTKDNYPVVDGSTATKPLAKAFYEAFTGEELETVDHSKTHQAYLKLMDQECDLILVVDPSEEELEIAREKGIDLEYHKIVNEAFVFFVNAQNPVKNLTLQQIRDIYSGKIRNWKELGGDDAEITAFQRPVNSGSQTGMLSLVMGDTPIMRAPEEQILSGMEDIVNAVSDYDNGRYAIGYSYYYYANTMYVGENCRMLAVDGAEPCDETIISGDYPILTRYIAVARREKSPETEQLLKAMLSDYGQKAAKNAGYVPVRPVEGDKAPDQEASSDTGLDPDSFFTPDPIILSKAEGSYRDHPAEFLQVDGLLDDELENQVNAYLRKFYETQYDALLDEGGSLAAGMKLISGHHITGAFADILSMSSSFYTEDYSRSADAVLTLDLRTVQELSLYDCFAKETKSAEVLKNGFYLSMIDFNNARTSAGLEQKDIDDMRWEISDRFDRREAFEFLVSPNGIQLINPFREEFYYGSLVTPFMDCCDRVVLYDRYKDLPALYPEENPYYGKLPVCVFPSAGGLAYYEDFEKEDDKLIRKLLYFYQDPEFPAEDVIAKMAAAVDQLVRDKAEEKGLSFYLTDADLGTQKLEKENGGWSLSGQLTFIDSSDQAGFERDYEEALILLRDPLRFREAGFNLFGWDMAVKRRPDNGEGLYPLYVSVELEFDEAGNLVTTHFR